MDVQSVSYTVQDLQAQGGLKYTTLGLGASLP